MIRVLGVTATALGLLFGGYWWAGSAAIGRGAAAVLDDLAAQGWTVRHDPIDTAGFPARFDLVLTGLDLRDPGDSFGWLMPELHLLTPSYWPTSVLARLPDSQTLILPDQRIAVSSSHLQVTLAVQARTSLPLQAITAAVGPLRLSSDLGWEASLNTASVSFHSVGGRTDQFDLTIHAQSLALPDQILDLINPDRHLPETIRAMTVAASLTFDRPLDRFAGQSDAPRLTSLTIRKIDIVWGDLGLEATGTLDIDASGQSRGEIIVAVTNWQRLIAMVVSAGLLAPGAAPTWERGLATLARDDGGLEVPITVRDGFMSLGPIPLGPAPRF